MMRVKRRTFSLLFSGALLAGACGGQAEQAPGTDMLSSSSGTGGAVAATGGSGTANGDSGAALATGGAPAGGGGAASASGGAAAGRGAGMPGSAGAATPAGVSGAVGAVDCNAVHDELDVAYDDARVCDPSAAEDECTAGVLLPYGCRTPFYFNPANADAIARFEAAGQALVAGCPLAPGGACASVIRGRCNPSTGLCEGVPAGDGRNCKVNGVVYASGEDGIYNPWNCSSCSCGDGILVCSPSASGCDGASCSDGQTLASGCVQCADYGVVTAAGPVTPCQTVEYGCFTPCSAGCVDPNSVCEDELCVPAACSVMNP